MDFRALDPFKHGVVFQLVDNNGKMMQNAQILGDLQTTDEL